MSAKRHPIRGLIFGLLAGFFGGLSLFLLGLVDSDSSMILVFMILMPIIGVVLGITQPIKIKRESKGGGDAAEAAG